MRLFAAALVCISVISCSFEHWVYLDIVIPEQHPFEKAFSETLWFTLSYFNGESVEERHIPTGMRSVRVPVRAGSLSVFSLRPVGELGAIGGFHEPGNDSTVEVLPEYGAFAEMLLRAASYRAEPVSRLSMRRVLDEVADLQAVDESSFLKDIFDGTLGYGITLNEKAVVRSDSIPAGEWVSERFDIPSFAVDFSGSVVSFLLYPGVYRYAEADRGLLLTLVVDETGAASQMITALPLW